MTTAQSINSTAQDVLLNRLTSGSLRLVETGGTTWTVNTTTSAISGATGDILARTRSQTPTGYTTRAAASTFTLIRDLGPPIDYDPVDVTAEFNEPMTITSALSFGVACNDSAGVHTYSQTTRDVFRNNLDNGSSSGWYLDFYTGHPQDGGTKLGEVSVGAFDISKPAGQNRFSVNGSFISFPDSTNRFGYSFTPTGDGIVNHVVYRNTNSSFEVCTTCPGFTVETGVDAYCEGFNIYVGA